MSDERLFMIPLAPRVSVGRGPLPTRQVTSPEGRAEVVVDADPYAARDRERAARQFVTATLGATHDELATTAETILAVAPAVAQDLTALAAAGRDRRMSLAEYRAAHEQLARRLAELEAQAENLPQRIDRYAAAEDDPQAELNRLRGAYPALKLPNVQVTG